MFKQLLESIAGVELYPILSLVLFMAIFGAVIVRVIRMDKKRVSHMSNLPLDNDSRIRE